MTLRRPAGRLDGLIESQIREMTRLAIAHDAVNCAQGFPDFGTPEPVRRAAVEAIMADHNQYAITWGVPALREAIAASYRARFAPHFDWVDPERHVTVTCGVTEAVTVALMALLEPGDEVIVLEPAHENYAPAARFAGGRAVGVPLLAPDFALDVDRLAAAVGPRTKALILNAPHNPTGRVFTRAELDAVAALCIARDLVAITDEIYDRIVYEPHVHVPLATLPGMRERTITLSGCSKTFAVMGWRLGYAVAPEPWSHALRTVHDFTTICAPTPLQHAAAAALALPESFFADQRAAYAVRRSAMLDIVRASGFTCTAPEGAYYLLCRFDAWRFDRIRDRDGVHVASGSGDSDAFARWLTEHVGVAVVAASSLYVTPGLGRDEVRFAFAKKAETLESVRQRLSTGFAKFAV
ncbi:MAG: aminotransferase class I/II-fold pyridoxal phosphate-dependent enzyme [Ardenticatenales bacterium]|nr:aminotransferase class I/II-fold pyridoxal phosphate-dependent enzyme [Ardenticatenales bacterium]